MYGCVCRTLRVSKPQPPKRRQAEAEAAAAGEGNVMISSTHTECSDSSGEGCVNYAISSVVEGCVQNLKVPR